MYDPAGMAKGFNKGESKIAVKLGLLLLGILENNHTPQVELTSSRHDFVPTVPICAFVHFFAFHGGSIAKVETRRPDFQHACTSQSGPGSFQTFGHGSDY